MSAQFPYFSLSQGNFFISTNPNLLDIDAIHHFLSEHSYWARGIARELVERSLRHSLCFGAYSEDNGEQVQIGFARAITDFTRFAYLADVFIDSDYQGRGLGKWLIATVLNHPELQTIRCWMLHTEDAHGLYRRFGFDTGQDLERYMSCRTEAG